MITSIRSSSPEPGNRRQLVRNVVDRYRPNQPNAGWHWSAATVHRTKSRWSTFPGRHACENDRTYSIMYPKFFPRHLHRRLYHLQRRRVLLRQRPHRFLPHHIRSVTGSDVFYPAPLLMIIWLFENTIQELLLLFLEHEHPWKWCWIYFFSLSWTLPSFANFSSMSCENNSCILEFQSGLGLYSSMMTPASRK